MYGCTLLGGQASLAINVDASDNVVSATVINTSNQRVNVTVTAQGDGSKTVSVSRPAGTGTFAIPLPAALTALKGVNLNFGMWLG